MFIAHLPTGYLLARYCRKNRLFSSLPRRLLVDVFLLGSIFPDVDLLYFYWIDAQSTHHHRYITHWPLWWVSLFMLTFLFCFVKKNRVCLDGVRVFCIAALGHLVLDSIVGHVWWLAPWVDRSYVLFTAYPKYKPWGLNFVLHWSLVLELVICASAYWVYKTPDKMPITLPEHTNKYARAHVPLG